MKNKKIYILHGWAYSIERWKPFINLLEKEGVEIEMLKIPGLTAPLTEVWDIDDYIKWLDKSLQGDKNQVTLLGHSNGGLISLAYALKYPEKVQKLILMDSTGIYHKELSIRLKRFFFASAARIGKKITRSEALRRLLYKLARAHDYENAPDKIIKKTMLNLIRTDLRDKFCDIKIPIIIIWGKNDQVTPAADGEIMNNEISNSSLHIINGARHSPQLTHPEETAGIILKNI